MDPATGLTILGGAVGSAKVLEKLLGPTADYLGCGFKDWTERGFKNVGRIFEIAKLRLGPKIDDPGGVPPRVLKEVLSEGPFCEDELWAEYFGGVLASSRSEVERDDRGARFASIISRLSTYQVRCHFVLYRLFKTLFDGVEDTVSTDDGRRSLEMFVPFAAFVSAMELTGAEKIDIILSHTIVGLAGESLLDPQYKFGGAEFIKTNGFPGAAQDGMLVRPSTLGAELFHWAHGLGNVHTGKFLDPACTFPSTIIVTVMPGVCASQRPDRKLDQLVKPSGPA
ncbi:MAG: hypothetical protein SF187_12910 [Deltaproteobacteria bacterium]|nr:hypothetical protein [Deltaproteobacteria bacterium]